MDEKLLEWLGKLHACEIAIQWASTQPNPETAWEKCEFGDWMWWFMRHWYDQKLPIEISLALARSCESAARAYCLTIDNIISRFDSSTIDPSVADKIATWVKSVHLDAADISHSIEAIIDTMNKRYAAQEAALIAQLAIDIYYCLINVSATAKVEISIASTEQQRQADWIRKHIPAPDFS
jgi:hypothetical protein